MTSDIYTYHDQGRTPFKVGATLVGLGFAAWLSTMGDAVHWAVWIPIVFFNGMMLWAVIANPKYSLTISPDTIVLTEPGGVRRFAVPDIAVVHIEEWSDSTDVTIHLKNGDEVKLPDAAHPSGRRLAGALEAAGIAHSGGYARAPVR